MVRSIFISLIVCISFFSCKSEDDSVDPTAKEDSNNSKPEDIDCENAQINLCNPTTDKIFVYGWNTNQVTDTLFPGECELYDVGRVVIKYNNDGSIKESFTSTPTLYNPSGSVSLGIESCLWRYEPESGYEDIAYCYNSKFDPKEGEHDTDCGGSCLPCGEIALACNNLVEDRFTLSNQSSDYLLSSTYDKNQINNKTYIEFTFYNGEVLNVSFPRNDRPLVDKRFLVGSEWWESDVWFTDRNGFNRYDAAEGSSVYFKVDANGNESIQFCDINFERSSIIIQGRGFLPID